MAGGPVRRKRSWQIGELTASLVEPVLARKAGMSLGLLSAWPEIVGTRLAGATRPERLQWPPQRYEDEPFRPATLIVACEGAFVLRLQHESGEVVQRLNAFFGYHAVGSLRIVQRAVAVAAPDRKPAWHAPDSLQQKRIEEAVSRIESDRLRKALERYGACVMGRNNGRKGL